MEPVVAACELQSPGGRVHLEVRDDGPGFPAEVLAAPVEGLLTTKEGRLSGLGLYTAECLVRAAGGTLERGNAEGGGAVVRMQLPLANAGVQG